MQVPEGRQEGDLRILDDGKIVWTSSHVPDQRLVLKLGRVHSTFHGETPSMCLAQPLPAPDICRCR